MRHAEPVKFSHAGNGRLRATARNLSQDILGMRSLWYDHGLRLRNLLQRYEQHGWTRRQIEDIVYYRTYRSLQPQDAESNGRQAIE